MKILLIAASFLSFANILTAAAAAIEQSTVQQHQMRKIQLNVENRSPDLTGYVLEVEIRKHADPIFVKRFDLNLAVNSSMLEILEIDFQDMKEVFASNLIVRLTEPREGGNTIEDRYVRLFTLDTFAGFKVVIAPKDSGNLGLGNKIEIFPTVDAAGTHAVE